MSDPSKPNDAAASDDRMNDPLVGALLAEVFGKATPPDLSGEIMRQWREASVSIQSSRGDRNASTKIGSSVAGQATRVAASASRSRAAGWLTAIAALAASMILGLVAWKFSTPKELGIRPIAKTPESVKSSAEIARVIPPIVTPGAESSVRETPSPLTEQLANGSPMAEPVKRTPPRSITLAGESPESRLSTIDQQPSPSRRQRPGRVAEPVQLVSAHAAEGLEEYWEAVGAEPSPLDSVESIRDRVKGRLGVELDPSWLSAYLSSTTPSDNGKGTSELEQLLRQEANAKSVASAWLKELTSGAIGKLSADERDVLIGELAAAFQGKESFDIVLSNWISGGGQGSSPWYTAMRKGGEFSMVRQLASLTMNVDLRCTRCHDSLIESTGLQNDYWSLAAMLRRDLMKDDSGNWKVRNSETDTSPVFYERLDGRQTMAEAGVPQHWLDENAAVRDIIQTRHVQQWGEAIVDSRPLARGVVNSLWRLVHDRPLRGDLADAASAPLDDSLLALEELLTLDLLASNFDVSRLLAIVLASPATMRSIPESLVRQDAWAMDAKKVRRAQQSVQAFAAAAPSPRLLSIASRIEVTQRSIGATLKGVIGNGTVLAQPLGEASTENPKKAKDLAPVANGFPDHVDELPVQWLASLGSLPSQVKHLGYLAGRDRLPNDIEPLSLAMQEADVPLALNLHRVWWLLQP